jgi:hypothetical protein
MARAAIGVALHVMIMAVPLIGCWAVEYAHHDLSIHTEHSLEYLGEQSCVRQLSKLTSRVKLATSIS